MQNLFQLCLVLSTKFCRFHHRIIRFTAWWSEREAAAASANAARAISSFTPQSRKASGPAGSGPPVLDVALALAHANLRRLLGTGLSGNTRIQVCPALHRARDGATGRFDLAGGQSARAVAFRPNSPKLTLLPDWARPRLRPFICFRNLVRFGCSIFLTLSPRRALGRRRRLLALPGDRQTPHP